MLTQKKSLAEKLKHVLTELISSNQTARCTSEIGRLISDVIEMCNILDIRYSWLSCYNRY